MELEKRISRTPAILAKATGYSEVYCRAVLAGRRSAKSKGGLKITAKHNELIKLIEVFNEKTVTNEN